MKTTKTIGIAFNVFLIIIGRWIFQIFTNLVYMYTLINSKCLNTKCKLSCYMTVLVRTTLSRYINPISWIDLTLQSYIKVAHSVYKSFVISIISLLDVIFFLQNVYNT